MVQPRRCRPLKAVGTHGFSASLSISTVSAIFVPRKREVTKELGRRRTLVGLTVRAKTGRIWSQICLCPADCPAAILTVEESFALLQGRQSKLPQKSGFENANAMMWQVWVIPHPLELEARAVVFNHSKIFKVWGAPLNKHVTYAALVQTGCQSPNRKDYILCSAMYVI